MFVTASTYNGSLGGITGANAKCNSDTNKLTSGTYKAFISINTNYPSATSLGINIASKIYSSNTSLKIADNYADLTDGSIENPVYPGMYEKVWTISNSEGDCSGWTSDGDMMGRYGHAINTNIYWRISSNDYCHNLNHIYCIGPI